MIDQYGGDNRIFKLVQKRCEAIGEMFIQIFVIVN